jgi:long-chain acyl-CoA synthetase
VKSIIKQIESVLREQWDREALTDWGSEVSFTYGSVATRICYMHLLFESLGIKPGDKVAICNRNCSHWAVSMLAVLTYRAVAVPLLPDYSKEQLKMLCEHCDAKFMIANHQLANLWPDGKCPMYMLDVNDLLAMTPSAQTDGVERKAFSIFAERYPNGYQAEDVHFEAEQPDDLMVLSYTSGSTGNPKGVMLPWRSLQSNMEFAFQALPCENAMNMFLILPMAHMFGFAFDFLYGILTGAHLYILTRIPAPQLLLNAFAEVKPDCFLCVPLVMEKIIKGRVMPVLDKPYMKVLTMIPGIRQLIFSKIRSQLLNALGGKVYEVIMGGAALSKDVEKILSMVKFPFTVGYGMTECGPIITYSDWKEHRSGSCGKAAVNMEVRVLSDDPQNVPGEIVAKGVNTMVGYYKNPDATAETIDEEGWLHTGDLGVMDQDGFIYIRGRKKNMLLGSNGQNIYPEEAEDQVVTHSIFDECVVVARDEQLVALVYVTDETLKTKGLQREQLDLDAICREVNLHLPKYCQLSKLEQRSEEFEKTPKRSIRRFKYK